jgi:homoserine dehydrogenase
MTRSAGERWKLIGSLEKEGGKLKASVKPQRLPTDYAVIEDILAIYR